MRIDFNLHTDGDSVFKAESFNCLLKHKLNLRQALDTAIRKNDPQVFLKACHKVYTAISMLDDPEFTHVVDKIRNTMRQANVAAGSLPSK